MCLFAYRATLLIYPSLSFHFVNTNLGTQTKWHFCCEAFKTPPAILCASCNSNNCNAGNTDREQAGGHTGHRRGWDEWRARHGHTHYHVWKRKPAGVSGMTQGTQSGTLWQPRGVGGKGHVHTYHWLMLMYDRNQHNSVKQLYFN